MHTRGLGCEHEVTKRTREGWGVSMRLQNAHKCQINHVNSSTIHVGRHT